MGSQMNIRINDYGDDGNDDECENKNGRKRNKTNTMIEVELYSNQVYMNMKIKLT